MAQTSLNSTGVASAGALSLQSNGTTEAIGISTAQVATFVKDAVVNGLTVGKGAGSVATNTAVGASALAANTSGTDTTAIGAGALQTASTAVSNTAVGKNALNATTGSNNTGVGHGSMATNTTGANNAALGFYSLLSNTSGTANIAIGREALNSNTTASNNTAVGYQAGYSNTTGTYQTFVGYTAGHDTTGTNSTFIGQGAGYFITTGAKNTILGQYNGNQGGLDIRTSSNNIVLSDGDGNPRGYFVSSGIFVAPATYTNTSANAANCYVGTDGSFVRSTSALKYKQDVRDLEELDISTLRPVRYKSKCEGDDQTKDHLGLIADEAADAGFEELVSRGADGEVEGFQYERLTVVLLKKLQTLDAEFKAYVAAHP